MSILLSLFSGIISGVVAGLIVYAVLEFRDEGRWRRSKNELIQNFDSALNKILDAAQIGAGIKAPELITSSEQYTQFIKRMFGYHNDYQALKNGINNMNEEQRQIFLSNIRNIQETIRFLLPLFTGFRRTENWYVEKLFTLNKKIYSASWSYITFPEVCDSKYKNKENLLRIRKFAVDGIVNLVDFTIKLQEELSSRP